VAPRSRKRKVASVAESSVSYLPRRILLDTHVWLWWYLGERRLGPSARSLIKTADEVRFSAASAWELAIKRGLGKLVVPGDLRLAQELERDGFMELPISVTHAEAVHALPKLHGDPFDRMLVAQAQLEGLAIVTADDAIARYDVAVIDARG
jgi:PIN domain nuclease of toxin-antitoxin system